MSGEDLRVIFCGLSGLADIYWATRLGKVCPELRLTRLRFSVSWLAIYFGLALYPISDPKQWGIVYAIITSVIAITTVGAAIEVSERGWKHFAVSACLSGALWAQFPAPSLYLVNHHQLLAALHVFPLILIRRNPIALTIAITSLSEALYYGWFWRDTVILFPLLQTLTKALGYLAFWLVTRPESPSR